MVHPTPTIQKPWNNLVVFQSSLSCLTYPISRQQHSQSSGICKTWALPSNGYWNPGVKFNEQASVMGHSWSCSSLWRNPCAIHRHRSRHGALGQLRPPRYRRGTTKRGLPLNQPHLINATTWSKPKGWMNWIQTQNSPHRQRQALANSAFLLAEWAHVQTCSKSDKTKSTE